MGEVGVNHSFDGGELQDVMKKNEGGTTQADSNEDWESTEPTIDEFLEGLGGSEGEEETEQSPDSQSADPVGEQLSEERFPNGVSPPKSSQEESSVDYRGTEESSVADGQSGAGSGAEVSEGAGSRAEVSEGAAAGPKIEYFCTPNQNLTSDAWKILFFHMLPFTTVPSICILVCLILAYRQWGWTVLVVCATTLALLSVSPTLYSRRIRAAISGYFYGLLARYVPSAQYIVPEKPFPEDRPYIFACHPHGRMFYSTIIFAQLHRTWRKNILQKGDLFMTAAGLFFLVPFLRNVFYMLGAIPVAKKDIVAKLKRKDHVTILIGGVKEVLLGTEDDVDRLYLRRRKGFCRIAIDQNAGVVPVYFFNENQMFMHNSKGFLRFWERVNDHIKVGVPFMRGRYLILPMPFRRPLMIAVGDPLFAKEGETVDEFHRRYMKALKELFDKYVPYSPRPNTKLIIE